MIIKKRSSHAFTQENRINRFISLLEYNHLITKPEGAAALCIFFRVYYWHTYPLNSYLPSQRFFMVLIYIIFDPS